MDADKLQYLRGAGIILTATAVLGAVLMHYHPHGDDGATAIRTSHGGLLLLVATQPPAMALVGRALSWRLGTAVALALFSFGALGALLAGTINGFVVPAIWSYPEGDIAPGVTALAWEMNQALATNGAVAVGAAIALYGVALWRTGWRWIGGAGMLMGATTAGLLLAGITDMQFGGAILTYVAQLVWLAALGIALIRAAGKVSSPSSP